MSRDVSADVGFLRSKTSVLNDTIKGHLFRSAYVMSQLSNLVGLSSLWGQTDEYTMQITEIRRLVDSSSTALKMEAARSSETSVLLPITMAQLTSRQ